jgi:spermidine/putrescine transport system ATP-binding protein
MSRIIETHQLTKTYGEETVVNDLNIWVKENQFLTLLGPSGCGKTTTLRMIGGFESPTSGNIMFEGKVINDIPPYQRQINTVFQKYALFPHLDVYENIAFGLRIKKVSESDIKKKVSRMLELVNLLGYEKRKINALSGGQQQRIAIARALVNEPKVLLLDEPLGALDLKLRKEMQLELKDMQQEVGITFIYVTHDQEEALTMSDKIIIMNKGLIQQIGSPTDIYNEPENAFVADFIGESNIIPGSMLKDFYVSFLGHEFVCVDKGFDPNEAVDIVIRPEDIEILPANHGLIQGVVTSTVFKGVHYEMLIESQGFEWLVHSTKARVEGEMVSISFQPEDIHVMDQVQP